MTTVEAREGMDRAEQHADFRFVAIIDAAIEAAIKTRVPFSANDIRAQMPTVTSRGLVGARVNAYANLHPPVMVKVGEEPSNLKSTHGKKIAVWLGAA